METVKSNEKKKPWLVPLLIVLGAGAFLFFSSFKAAASPTLPDPDGEPENPPETFDCQTNAACILGYWKWKLLRDRAWLSSLIAAGPVTVTSLTTAVSTTAATKTTQPVGSDFTQWNALVQLRGSQNGGNYDAAISAIVLELIYSVVKSINANTTSPDPHSNADGLSGHQFINLL